MAIIKSGLFRGHAGSTPVAGNGDPSGINLRANAEGAPRLFEPGEYLVAIESAAFRFKSQNAHLTMIMREAESGRLVDLPPMWIDGPNANRGPLAARNAHLAAEINAICGATDAFALTQDALKAWVGKKIGVLLAVEKGLGGAPVNALKAVCDENGSDAVLGDSAAVSHDPTA